MKATPEKIEIDPKHSISWDKVKALWDVNGTLIIKLKNYKEVDVRTFSKEQRDDAFKYFIEYLRKEVQ